MDSLDKIFEGQKELNKKLVSFLEERLTVKDLKEEVKTVHGKLEIVFKFKLAVDQEIADNGYKNGTYSKYDENGIEDNRSI